jgi:DNA end-binding protein Ku
MKSIWSGSLSFGLINIPVKIYSASEERAIKFKLLDKNGHDPISYSKINKSTGKEVKLENIVRGYEYRPGEYIVITEEELKKAAPKKSKLIEVINFVAEEEIPFKNIDKPYYIEPDKGAEKAYVLLREALKKSNKVGISKIIMHDKEHLGMIRTEDNAMMLITLRYKDEIRTSDSLNIPEKSSYSQKELEMALMLIKQLEEDFNFKDYQDTYALEVKKLVEKKAKGQPIKISEKGIKAPTSDMRDLMGLLRQSLKQHSQRPHKSIN